MKVIILAAGSGKRMKHLTKDKPKCMINFLGKPIIKYQVDLFKKIKIIDEIVILRGYKYEMVKFSKVRHYNILKSRNMVETLFKAEKELNDDVLITYGDVIFSYELINLMVNAQHNISVLIDKNWYNYYKIRFRNPYEEAESCILDNNNFIKNIGEKEPPFKTIEGQFVGAIKLSANGCEIVKKFYASLKNKYEGKIWIRNRFFEEMFMTDLLQGLIEEGIEINAILCNNGWLEFDTLSDLRCYESLQNKNELVKIIKI